MTAIFTESEYEIELSAVQGPAGAGLSAIPNNTLLGNTSGSTATPVARTAAQMGLQPYNAKLDSVVALSTPNLPLITGDDGVIVVGSFGTTANTFCEGDDSRVANAVQSNVSYANPTWITEIAASKITGTLAKSQQHAQTAYKDEANTWAETQTFNGNVIVGASIASINATTGAILSGSSGNGRVGLYPGDNSGTGYVGWFKPNGSRQGYFGFDSGNDMTFQNEQGGSFSFNNNIVTGGFLSVYSDSYLNGIASFRGTDFVTRATINGNTGQIAFKDNVWNISNADGARRLFFENNSTTYIAGSGSTSVQLRNSAEQSLVSFNTFQTIFHSSGGGSAGSILAGQATFNGTVTSTSTGKLGDFTVGTLPSAASNAGHEANVTDSSVTTFGSTVAGGGSSNVKVRSNGTNWTVTGI